MQQNTLFPKGRGGEAVLEYQLNYLGGMNERAPYTGLQGGKCLTARRGCGAESEAGLQVGAACEVGRTEAPVARCLLTPNQRICCPGNEGHYSISQMSGGKDLPRVTPSSG